MPTPAPRHYIRRHVTLSPGHDERLRSLAQAAGVTDSELVRRLIDQAIAPERVCLWRRDHSDSVWFTGECGKSSLWGEHPPRYCIGCGGRVEEGEPVVP